MRHREVSKCIGLFEAARSTGARSEAFPRPYRGRLAPSPSGELHLGHAQTFWIAYQRSLSNCGDLILRIEDLDGPRCKPQFYDMMYQTILWFGIKWTLGPRFDGELWESERLALDDKGDLKPTPTAKNSLSDKFEDGTKDSEANIQLEQVINVGPYLQSERKALYQHAWTILYNGGYIYPSNHSRKNIQQALSAPHEGEGEVVFPTSLRCDQADVPTGLLEPDSQSWRFRVPDGETITFTDSHMGARSYVAGADFGDFLIWRFDGFPSYEMAVVVDDLAMGVTEIVRGEDLLLSTARQILLYWAFGITDLNLPRFFHTPLVRDPETGKRLAKRDGARSMRTLYENGWMPEKLREKLCCFDGVIL